MGDQYAVGYSAPSEGQTTLLYPTYPDGETAEARRKVEQHAFPQLTFTVYRLIEHVES